MTTARKFTSVSIRRGEKLQRGFRVECSRCGTTESIPLNTYRGRGDDDDKVAAALAKKFEARGWKIGSGVTHDVCMACQILVPGARTKPTLKLVGEAMKDTTANTPPIEAMMQKDDRMGLLPPAVAALAPRELGVMDALTIREKLSELYLDKERGYDRGFTDKKIAEDLNVPRDWVRQVREHVYGKGSAGNGDIAETLAEARALLVQMESSIAGVDAVVAEAKRLTDAIAPLRGAVARIERDLRHIEQSLK